MLTLNGILEFLNHPERRCPDEVLRWRNVYYDMSLHIDAACPAYTDPGSGKHIFPTNYFGEQYQWIFNNRLYSRHPREHELQRNWRLSQHRPFTQQPFLQVIQVLLGAIFQDSGYSINISNREDNDYIWGNNFEGKNLVGYISDKFQNICTDPNGVFVVIPKEPGNKTTTAKVEPQIVWIPSRFIEYKTHDEIAFYFNDFLWWVNPFGYFRYRQTEDEQWEAVDGTRGYYGHMLLRLPHHTGGGIWNTQGFYESWLQSGKAWADEFVSNKSAEQHVNKEASYPFVSEMSTDCPDCNEGKVQACARCEKPDIDCNCADGYQQAQYNCRRCAGTGVISRNPGDHILVAPKDMDKDPVKFISPDISINAFHAKNNADLFNALYRALYQNYIDQAQSGVAKEKDMEAKYLFTLSICNDLFDRVIPGIINDILSLRNIRVVDGKRIPDPGDYEIVKPTRFQLKTAFELLEEYKEATDSGIPNSVLAKQLEDYTDKQFGGDDVLKRKVNFINQRDPLALEAPANVQLLVTNGAASQRDWQYSLMLSSMLDKVRRDKSDEWFKKATYDQIDKEVDTIFATIPAPNIAPVNTIDQNRV